MWAKAESSTGLSACSFTGLMDKGTHTRITASIHLNLGYLTIWIFHCCLVLLPRPSLPESATPLSLPVDCPATPVTASWVESISSVLPFLCQSLSPVPVIKPNLAMPSQGPIKPLVSYKAHRDLLIL
jgi:hypothetical protein